MTNTPYTPGERQAVAEYPKQPGTYTHEEMLAAVAAAYEEMGDLLVKKAENYYSKPGDAQSGVRTFASAMREWWEYLDPADAIAARVAKDAEIAALKARQVELGDMIHKRGNDLASVRRDLKKSEAENERLRGLAKKAYFEGWGDFETPCAPMRDVEEVWAESATRTSLQKDPTDD